MDYRSMTRDELVRLKYQAIGSGSMNAAVEVDDFIRTYNKRVRVVKGRKVPKGTEGIVFWLKRYNNGKYGDPWGIYSVTKVGIKDDAGTVWFTAIDNVEVIEKENTDYEK